MQYHTEPVTPANARANRSLEHKLTALSPAQRVAIHIVIALFEQSSSLQITVNQSLNYITHKARQLCDALCQKPC